MNVSLNFVDNQICELIMINWVAQQLDVKQKNDAGNE